MFDAGEIAFQPEEPEADRAHQILGFCHISFSLVAHMDLILNFFLLSVKRSFQKCIHLPPPPPPPPIYASQVGAKYMKMCDNTPILTEPTSRHIVQVMSVN